MQDRIMKFDESYNMKGLCHLNENQLGLKYLSEIIIEPLISKYLSKISLTLQFHIVSEEKVFIVFVHLTFYVNNINLLNEGIHNGL